MGFVSLKEAAKVGAMSVVFFCLIKGQQPQPSPQTRYALVDEFVFVFGKTPPGTVPSLNRYPANPAELGKQWLDQVYGADEPAMVSIGAGWKNMVKTPETSEFAQYEQEAFNKLAKAKAGAKSKIFPSQVASLAKPSPKTLAIMAHQAPEAHLAALGAMGTSKAVRIASSQGSKGLRFKSKGQWTKYKLALDGAQK
eukprot:s2754_g11.t1